MIASEVYAWLDQRAPFETQQDYDNSGFLVGDPSAAVTGIHFALDCTPAVLDEMEVNGSNLLVTHHPLMFTPLRRVLWQDYEGGLIARMLKSGFSMIASHTCLDQAPGGINDALAARIGLQNIAGDGFLRIGLLKKPISAGEFALQLAEHLGDSVRIMGNAHHIISSVAVCSGAGGSEWQAAHQLGASAFVTGEMKHHLALEASSCGMVCFECGHAATEVHGIAALKDALQREAFVVESGIRVTMSCAEPYGEAGAGQRRRS